MEWNIKTISQHCAVCGAPFLDDEEVLSLIFKSENGDIQRFDVSKKCASSLPFHGELIGQWKRFFSSKNSSNLKSTQELAIREEFFFSLFEGKYSKEKEILKQLVSLLLEKKRVLKRISETSESVTFIHIRTKREFIVSNKEILPEELTSFSNIFEMLA